MYKSINFNKYIPIYLGLCNKNQHWELSKFLNNNFIDKLPLTYTQIDCLHDIVNWNLISNQDLPDFIIIKYKKYINWEIYLQTKYKKNILCLKNAKKYVETHMSLFFKINMKNQYYTEHFIDIFSKLIDWKWLIVYFKLSEHFLLKYWHKFDTRDISRYQTITKKIFIKKYQFIDWITLSKRKLSIKFIMTTYEYLHLPSVCKYNHLPEFILEKFIDILPADIISTYQYLSNRFIKKHYKKLNMYLISTYQNMSAELIKELEHYIHFEKLLQNKWYNHKNSIQILIHNDVYYIISPPIIGSFPRLNYINVNSTLND